MRQRRKKKKKEKNVLSLSTGQGRDEVCRALHRTDARAFHKNTLKYSYRTIISRFRSPTLYILFACYIVYPDFPSPPLRVSYPRSFASFFGIRDRDRCRRTVGTNASLRSLVSTIRLIRHPIHPFFEEDILRLSWFERLRRGGESEKKKGERKDEDFYRGETTISIRFHFALIIEGMLVVFTLRHFRCLF